MKTISKEIIKIAFYIIIGIIFILSSYTIILNINHTNALSKTTIVSEADNDYSKYKENVSLIENYIKSHDFSDNKLYLSLTKVIQSMKQNGVYRLIPKTKLNNKDLYELNDYFMEELINNNWVSNLKQNSISDKYQDSIMILVNNSNYLTSVLTNNSIVLTDGNLDNKVEDNYRFILNNYLMYSNIILNYCNELGGVNG